MRAVSAFYASIFAASCAAPSVSPSFWREGWAGQPIATAAAAAVIVLAAVTMSPYTWARSNDKTLVEAWHFPVALMIMAIFEFLFWHLPYSGDPAVLRQMVGLGFATLCLAVGSYALWSKPALEARPLKLGSLTRRVFMAFGLVWLVALLVIFLGERAGVVPSTGLPADQLGENSVGCSVVCCFVAFVVLTASTFGAALFQQLARIGRTK